MDDDAEPGTVIDLIIENINFPRGGGAVTGEVVFTFVPDMWQRDGAEIRVLTSARWDRRTDLTDDVRRALAKSAHRLLKGAAALSDERLRHLLDAGLAESTLPEAQPDRREH